MMRLYLDKRLSAKDRRIYKENTTLIGKYMYEWEPIYKNQLIALGWTVDEVRQLYAECLVIAIQKHKPELGALSTIYGQVLKSLCLRAIQHYDRRKRWGFDASFQGSSVGKGGGWSASEAARKGGVEDERFHEYNTAQDATCWYDDYMVENVRKYVEALPPGKREVIELHYFHGIPFNEIARRLGKSHQRVNQIRDECFRYLRSWLENRAAC